MRISDWSSDVCSSDLPRYFGRRSDAVDWARADGAERGMRSALSRPAARASGGSAMMERLLARGAAIAVDRKSVVSGKSVSVRVDLGGRRIIKKKQQKW